MSNKYERIVNTIIPGSQPQINANTTNTSNVTTKTNKNTSAIAVGDQLYVKGDNYTNNDPSAGNSIHNLYQALAAASPPIITAISPGRTITFKNNTSSTTLDLYVTVGGANPQPITLVTTINVGGMHVWDISDTIYDWNGNFTVMPTGVSPPQFNAGPTVAEFGVNQLWHGFTPDMRDTFDISTVPPGIGTKVNDGPRSLAVQISRQAGFSKQQAFNYNVGIQIVPPATTSVPPLPTVTVTCTATNGDSPGSIGFPNDTALPKQQTGDALGNYTVNFIDPVVTVP